jgi:hypothetical protein
MQLQFHAGVPLLVGHFQNIDLRHGAGDVGQRIDAAKPGHRVFDDCFRRGRLAQVRGDDQRLGAGRLDRLGGFIQALGVAGNDGDGAEVAGDANRGGPADTLASASHNGDGFVHDAFL